MRRLTSALIAVAMLSGCADAAGTTAGVPGSAAPTGSTSPGTAPDGEPPTGAPAGPTAAPAQPGTTEPPAADGSPASEPTFRDLAMTVTVTPSCVALGGTAELRVESDEGVQVVWGAVYDGGEGGGDPPLGSGHGGNGSGVVGADRAYVATWTVRPSAPTGSAHVIVQAGIGDRYGYREVPFEVVGSTADC